MAYLIIAFFVIIFSLCYYLFTRKYDYWKKRNVPHLEPTTLFGNYKDYLLLKTYLPQVISDVCKKFPNQPYVGAYYGTEPALIVKDPDYLKLIMTKDFYYFNSREIGEFTDKEVITRNIFFIGGDRWKILRQNFTPLFSSAKMKKMFYLIEECSTTLEKLIDKAAAEPSTETRLMMSRFTIDCIGSCAFGLNTKCLIDSTNPFLHIGQRIFEMSSSRALRNIGRALWPSIFYKLGLTAFPAEISEFFAKLLVDVFEQRQYKDSGRHDFVDLMLSLKENKYITGDSIANIKGDDKKTTLEVDNALLCAQATVFFAAGYETSSGTLSYLLYELAKCPEAQERAIAETDEYFKKNNKLFYECIHETPYIQACMNETLRLYPVLGVLTREVVEDYTLPSGLVLNKDLRVHIPVYHLHRDPNNFPEPDTFRPERFLEPEKDNIKPFTYMPFGDGPRICLGMRFAKMQMTAGLLTVLKKCRVELAENMPKTLVFDARPLTTQTATGIKLKFVPRQ
ncbi:cytochrome P450 6B5-like [Zerene cesonia]|uniref:cytochrome P450 6B5-like n=1 Tax=Zerene cesonia TaxID=33412 RepID=UPI0018E58697|nr:cytochrome P450 6B5-like [Zerene cesonia]